MMKTSERRSGIILIFLYPTDTMPMNRLLLLLQMAILKPTQRLV